MLQHKSSEHPMNRILAFLLVAFLTSCQNSDSKNRSDTGKDAKTEHSKEDKEVLEPNNINIYALPGELKEISGITFLDDHTVMAIQDEEGILYYYDLNKKEIVKKQEFWKGKDYEDLVIAGNDLYVLQSNGTLYELKNFRAGITKPAIYKTQLSSDNNMEGLAYDQKNNRLLLSVKDLSLDGDKSHKDIYAFDLKTKTLDTKAVYSISLAEVESYFSGDKLEEFSKKLLKRVGNKNLNEVFRTSAITFNPKTGELYALSSLNNIIAILDKNSKITRILEFDGKEFSQPEGLAFAPNGKLYISNEGKKFPANIIEVNYAE
ncbi:SdiA-regulated domain-containing protein [Desertivirga brevis]|uniref:SdiA-regulated domain-containing protein n=1 Tax=Desertivirga brevis TaxID=2810310 RepID=UPI001A95AA0A|nr:SdiA-regulated domain-containing protein [Pedobacter sp. SYSU D00873]